MTPKTISRLEKYLGLADKAASGDAISCAALPGVSRTEGPWAARKLKEALELIKRDAESCGECDGEGDRSGYECEFCKPARGFLTRMETEQ